MYIISGHNGTYLAHLKIHHGCMFRSFDALEERRKERWIPFGTMHWNCKCALSGVVTNTLLESAGETYTAYVLENDTLSGGQNTCASF